MERQRNEFSHVYWLSGAPCAGKSSIARMLARAHGLLLYSTDEHIMGTHLGEADAALYPAIERARNRAETYFEPSSDLILETTFAYLREAWNFVLADIRRLPADRGVLVEGVALFPDLVLEVTDQDHVACIVPSEDFYALNQPGRLSTVNLLKASPDPGAAYERMSAEHAELSRYFLETSARYGIRVFQTSSDESLLENLKQIESWFGFLTP